MWKYTGPNESNTQVARKGRRMNNIEKCHIIGAQK
jgi:hypothetical protein